MTPSIRRGCRYDCAHTWRDWHGSNRSIPGTSATEGDVRLCEHGRVWLATGRVRESVYFTQHDEWERLSPWATPFVYRRAVNAICAEIEAEGSDL